MKPSPSPLLVSLSPSDVLSFNLGRDYEARTVLKVTNISSNKIVFKVKTTQPSWYYVRPNQQVLDVGQSEDVVIALVEAEGNRLLDLSAADQTEKIDKHRFLVQSKILTDQEFVKFDLMKPAEKVDEFTKIWNTSPKDERKNLKLKVDFIYPTEAEKSQSFDKELKRSSSDNAELLRNRLGRNETIGKFDNTINSETMLSELLTLRKKYDAVVEYTVHLTAERDTIVAQLEELQRDYAREVGNKKHGSSIDIKASGVIDKKVTQQGLSLLLVVIVAILSYCVGKYIEF